MMLQSTSKLIILLGAVVNTLACVIPTTPLPNNITDGFSIFVQNSSLPAVHNRVMNFRPNGLDKHLVLRPEGEVTGDLLFVQNGFLTFEGRRAVIDLEYNPNDDTTKMFMTDRTYAFAVFQPIYVCDQDTDQLQIALQLVSRLLDPPVNGGQIGIQTAGTTYEFRYSPPNNPLLDARWFAVTMVIFRNGSSPNPPISTTTTTTAANPAATPAVVGNYQFVSCWAEPDAGRTLPTVFTAADMTNAKCAGLCAGSQYFGTQWSVECWCGATLAAGSAAAPGTDCANTCGGNPAEICGGGRRLSLYTLSSGPSSNLTTTSTTTSSTTTSSTTTSKTTTSSSTSTTTTPLTTTSSTTTSLTTTSSTTPSLTTTSSTTSKTTTTTTASTTTSSTTTTTTTTTSATPIASGTLPAVGSYSYVSCWAEPANGARTLTSDYLNTGDMTLEKCADYCSFYPYFGTQWSRECWCGDQLTTGSAAAPATDCSYTCIGNATELCGGSRRLSLYHIDGWTGPPTPGSVGRYNWLGCITDSPLRTLNSASLSSSAMTLEMCATFCAGYTYFGTEWSIECWCGNALTAGSAQVSLSQCSTNCGGNAKEKCGNGNRLSVYQLGP